MTSNLEDALSLPELLLIADIFDPTFRHRSRIDDHTTADILHARLLYAIRRQRFHEAVAERAVDGDYILD